MCGCKEWNYEQVQSKSVCSVRLLRCGVVGDEVASGEMQLTSEVTSDRSILGEEVGEIMGKARASIIFLVKTLNQRNNHIRRIIYSIYIQKIHINIQKHDCFRRV